MKRFATLAGLAVLLCAPALAPAQDTTTRQKDVIYGRKYGMALTMDVFAPKEKANGLGVIFVISGGWFSDPASINPLFAQPFLKRGYTVFAVCHGSQPKFTLPEIIDDMHRAVRFVRHHAKEYKIDADRLGMAGASAGGHLSLMMGTAGKDGDPAAKDLVDRGSSKVQCVACFFPPTDLLNWGVKGNERIDRQFDPPYTAAVDYHTFDKAKARFVPVTDKDQLRRITREVSPVYHVTEASAATLIIHGDADTLVPLQQGEVMVERLREKKVPAELLVRKGAGHGWVTILADVEKCADWFDKHLAKK